MAISEGRSMASTTMWSQSVLITWVTITHMKILVSTILSMLTLTIMFMALSIALMTGKVIITLSGAQKFITIFLTTLMMETSHFMTNTIMTTTTTMMLSIMMAMLLWARLSTSLTSCSTRWNTEHYTV